LHIQKKSDCKKLQNKLENEKINKHIFNF